MASPATFDDLRALTHSMGFAVYAYEPGEPVTLEILSPDGQTWRYQGATLAEAIAAAYPPAPEPVAPPAAPAPPPIDIFA